MVKLLFICSTMFVITGCYTCQEAFSMNYDSCMRMRNDKEYCLKTAEMQAETDGYCSSTNMNFGYNYNYR